MASKKRAEDITAGNIKIDSNEAATEVVAMADAMAPVDEAQIKAPPAPNVKGDNIRQLADEAFRGGIKFQIRAGTEEVRNVNAKDKTINTGGAALHSNQVHLQVKSVKVNVG